MFVDFAFPCIIYTSTVQLMYNANDASSSSFTNTTFSAVPRPSAICVANLIVYCVVSINTEEVNFATFISGGIRHQTLEAGIVE